MPWDTLLTSVVLYIVVPVMHRAGVARGAAARGGRRAFDAALARIGPWSIAALLATLVLLFAFPGRGDPPAAAGHRDAGGADPDPGVLQRGLAYWLNRLLGESHSVACPSALIGASNFFELAVAAAISLFGFESGAALATVVGVLIEVPVMWACWRPLSAVAAERIHRARRSAAWCGPSDPPLR